MKLVLLSLAFLSDAIGSSDLARKIHRDITKYNNDVACWGKKNTINFNVALMGATEECYNSPSRNLLKPVNPFLSILTPTNNPFQTLPAPVNKPFQTLPASTQRFQAQNQVFNLQKWNSLWSTVFEQPSTRGKRAAKSQGLLDADEEDFQEFLEDFKNFKEDMTTKMSNLTCVLSKMEMLDSNLQVNMQGYSQDMWKEMDLSETLAASDPEWRNMLVTRYKDCYSIAQNWPQETLDNNPITKVFGRHMVFFKCARKVEDKSCMEAQANDWLETMYGKDPSFNYAQFGLPTNKYERAAVAIKVMTAAASDEEEFVGDFFYGKNHM